jgi:ribonuclease Y
MNRKEAKDQLLATLKNEVTMENQQWIAKAEDDAKLKAKEQAVAILCTAMQRYVADQVANGSSGVVVLPSEEIKGKIIGKEGRNIKSLEMATGMEFVIGDTSETITISGFNPVRREIARKALTILLADGRINPTRIEEVVAKCESEVNESIEEVGQQVVLEFGFSGMHKEIIKMIGMLQFRTSYTQNVLEHSKETAYFSRMIAEELGLNSKIAARCGLLHDIGKAVSHEIEGPHAIVGSEFLRKHGEHPIIVNAVAAHHDDVVPSSVYAIIVMIADAMSASRTGARKETLAAYIKRLEQLEEIASSFEGVKKAYALQAGREVRVIVDENELDDAASHLLARELAARIEKEMSFPGQIKINVIREKRHIEYAK